MVIKNHPIGVEIKNFWNSHASGHRIRFCYFNKIKKMLLSYSQKSLFKGESGNRSPERGLCGSLVYLPRLMVTTLPWAQRVKFGFARHVYKHRCGDTSLCLYITWVNYRARETFWIIYFSATIEVTVESLERHILDGDDSTLLVTDHYKTDNARVT